MVNPGNIRERAEQLEAILDKYGIKGKIIQIDIGPQVSRYHCRVESAGDVTAVKQSNKRITDAIKLHILQIPMSKVEDGILITTDANRYGVYIDLPNVMQ